MDILFSFFILSASVLAIGKGSDWLSDSLIPLAKRLGVSGASVGLILVSVAVSLPEILVAVYAALKGHSDISLGVVLGSIVCNIGLMTGFCALIRPLRVSQTTLLRDGIFSTVVPILVFAVSNGGRITRFEGLAFLLLFVPYVINVFLQEKQVAEDQRAQDLKEAEVRLDLLGFGFAKLKSPWFAFILGMVLLLAGAQIFSNQLVGLAKWSGMSDLFIGLTIGAIGPSIPNIMAAYQATRKGMDEVAVSETLGSNIFTLLVTLGVLALLSPITITDQWLDFDLPVLVGMSFLLFFFILTGRKISKLEGGLLMAAYLVVLILQGVFYS
jgi:cation:H+ antiporter